MKYVVIDADEIDSIWRTDPPTVLFRGSYDACDAYCFKYGRDHNNLGVFEETLNRAGDDVCYSYVPSY